MIIAIVGVLDDENKYIVQRYGSVKGIGKTMVLTYFGALYKVFETPVFSNYTTAFTDKMTLRTMINKVERENIKNPTLLVSEMHTVLSNYEKKERKDFYAEFVRQIRKINGTGANLFYDTQLFMDINKTLRKETDFVFTTEKFHKDDDSLCVIDYCDRAHYIKLYKVKPAPFVPLPFTVDCELFGKMYNTREVLVREN